MRGGCRGGAGRAREEEVGEEICVGVRAALGEVRGEGGFEEEGGGRRAGRGRARRADGKDISLAFAGSVHAGCGMSDQRELALERIRAAAASGSEKLDLSAMGLTELPDKLWEPALSRSPAM